jgi:hypothetical protein
MRAAENRAIRQNTGPPAPADRAVSVAKFTIVL